MGLKINTNIAALNAQRQLLNTDNMLNKSLERLSSGLRINRSADDASGLAIADGLKAQANGLTQAIRNAGDGIALIQVADGALEESINIIQTIRSKSLQAASDGQNTQTRGFIQADIERLLEAMNNIASNTSFNGQNILDGSYENKKFQVGAFSGETISVSVGSALVSDLGAVSRVQSDQTLNGGAGFDNTPDQTVNGDGGMAIARRELIVNNVDVTETLNDLGGSRLLDARTVAEAITDATGIVSYATNEHTGDTVGTAVIDGTDTDYIKINGVDIGAVNVVAGDVDGSLVDAINNVSEQSGVRATAADGRITLIADDGRNIALDLTADGETSLGFTSNAMTETGPVVAGLVSTTAGVTTIAAGELVINGVDLEGTYGTASGAGSAATALQSAIRGIAGMQTASISAAGEITIEMNTGEDLNLGGTAVATYFDAALLQNDSLHGQVNMLTSESVVVTTDGDSETLGFEAKTYAPQTEGSIDEVNVTSRPGAEAAIVFADAALKALEEVRADLGSVQNQMETTVRNITVTRVNVFAAESVVRDVDFAQESSTFAKFQILAQSGSFALAQANTVQQNVLSLLQ